MISGTPHAIAHRIQASPPRRCTLLVRAPRARRNTPGGPLGGGGGCGRRGKWCASKTHSGSLRATTCVFVAHLYPNFGLPPGALCISTKAPRALVVHWGSGVLFPHPPRGACLVLYCSRVLPARSGLRYASRTRMASPATLYKRMALPKKAPPWHPSSPGPCPRRPCPSSFGFRPGASGNGAGTEGTRGASTRRWPPRGRPQRSRSGCVCVCVLRGHAVRRAFAEASLIGGPGKCTVVFAGPGPNIRASEHRGVVRGRKHHHKNTDLEGLDSQHPELMCVGVRKTETLMQTSVRQGVSCASSLLTQLRAVLQLLCSLHFHHLTCTVAWQTARVFWECPPCFAVDFALARLLRGITRKPEAQSRFRDDRMRLSPPTSQRRMPRGPACTGVSWTGAGRRQPRPPKTLSPLP